MAGHARGKQRASMAANFCLVSESLSCSFGLTGSSSWINKPHYSVFDCVVLYMQLVHCG